jgi:hypothetical protein
MLSIVHFIEFISISKPFRSPGPYVHAFVFNLVRLVCPFGNRHDYDWKIANLKLINGNT